MVTSPRGLHRGRQRDRRRVVRLHRLRPVGATAVQVDRSAPGDREQPRRQRAARLQRPAGAPGVQERDLNGVRGQFAVTEDPQRDRVHRPGVALVDGTNPFGATRAKGVGKTILVHWTGLVLVGQALCLAMHSQGMGPELAVAAGVPGHVQRFSHAFPPWAPYWVTRQHWRRCRSRTYVRGKSRRTGGIPGF